MDEWIDCPECKGWTSAETGMDCAICDGEGSIHNPDWDDDVADEVARQIMATSDADVLARKWPPLVVSAIKE